MEKKAEEEKKVSTNLKKKADGYNYKYTELAQINEYIDELGERYYQYPEPDANGYDYMWTVRIIDGKPTAPIRGCRIVDAKLQGKSNPAQEYGSALTYARRYSLLMAYGLATTDDDALTFDGAKEVKPKADLVKSIGNAISKYADEHGLTIAEIKKDYQIGAQVSAARLKEVYKDLTGEDYAE